MLGYWPIQASPRAYRALDLSADSRPFLPEHTTATSLAGVAARAVNEGRHDELLWLRGYHLASDEWVAWTAGKLALVQNPDTSLWEQAARLRQAGLLRGYVLYHHDTSPGGAYHEREGLDESANVATMIAAAAGDLLLVDESLEHEAQAAGLPLVEDARGQSPVVVLARLDGQLSCHGILATDPVTPHMRDFAVAFRLPVVYGINDEYTTAIRRSYPNALVQGWNCGDESQHTQPPTRLGLVHTASNWAWNLVFTAAGAGAIRPEPPPAPVFEPEAAPAGGYAAFLVSDGDNVQWTTGGFFRDSWWGSPLRGSVPVGWTMNGASLAQACPAALARLFDTMTPNDDFVEYGGGYFYPDLFAVEREDRHAALVAHARMLAHRMPQGGSRVLGFICKDVASPASREAYEIFAEHIPSLAGMIAVQYAPYNGGHGNVYWVSNPAGERIPVLTPRYALWEHANWKGGGTPAAVAAMANQHAAEASAAGEIPFSLVVVHAWSSFLETQDDDPRAEDVPRDAPPEARARAQGTMPAIAWTARRLDPSIKVVTPEEMIWRLRHQDPRANPQSPASAGHPEGTNP